MCIITSILCVVMGEESGLQDIGKKNLLGPEFYYTISITQVYAPRKSRRLKKVILVHQLFFFHFI